MIKFKDKTERIIVFVDMAESSLAWADDPTRMKTSVLPEYLTLIVDLALAHGGLLEESNFTGDGMMLMFPVVNPERAIAFGWELVEKWTARRAALGCSADPNKIRGGVRVGVHAGIVYLFADEDGKLNCCSDAINKAQRVESAIKEIKDQKPEWKNEDCCLITQQVVDSLRSQLDWGNNDFKKFFDLDSHSFTYELKKREKRGEGNYSDPLIVYRVTGKPPIGEEQTETKPETKNSLEAAELFSLGLKSYHAGDFEKAESLFAQADKQRPNHPDTLVNWGNSLNNQGKYPDAIEKYKRADKLLPNDPATLYNWGNSLSHLGKYPEAIEKYKRADELRPNHPATLMNWGNSLNNQGKYPDAIEKYKRADELRPNHPDTLMNWAASIINLSYKVKGAEREKLLAEAEEKCLRVESIEPGRAAYYLASIFALRNDSGKCREWLLLARERGKLPEKKLLEKDRDLDNVRGEAWFKKLLASL